eukprot:m.137429 g.137429  ORF g.137429 m.137429 type:complete len:252 (-) comp16054_c1_seq5:7518-8273(-)
MDADLEVTPTQTTFHASDKLGGGYLRRLDFAHDNPNTDAELSQLWPDPLKPTAVHSPDATQAHQPHTLDSPAMLDILLDARDGQHELREGSPMRYYSDPCLAMSSLHPDHRARRVQARFEQLTLSFSPRSSLDAAMLDNDDVFDNDDTTNSTTMVSLEQLSHHLENNAMDAGMDHEHVDDDDTLGSPDAIFECVRTNVTIPQFQAQGSPVAKRPLRERRHTYHGDALDGWQPGFNPISSPLREGAHLHWHA